MNSDEPKHECANCGKEYDLDELDEIGWCENCIYADDPDEDTEEDESD